MVDLPLQATLRNDDNIAKDGNATIAIKAVAVEHDGFQTKTAATGNPSEVDATNNVSVSDADAPISWATLENEFTVTPAKPVFENDQKHQNTGGSDPEYGTTITIKAGDVSEVIDSLTISYASVDGTPAAGKIVLDTGNGSFAEIASGSTITFEYDAKNPNQCVRVNYNDADGNAQSLDVPNLTLDQLTSQILRYIPDADGNHSDKDITVTLTGTTRETESGEKGELKVEPIRINVDAVADKASQKMASRFHTIIPNMDWMLSAMSIPPLKPAIMSRSMSRPSSRILTARKTIICSSIPNTWLTAL